MKKLTFFDFGTDINKYVFFANEEGNVEMSVALLTLIMEDAGCGLDASYGPQTPF